MRKRMSTKRKDAKEVKKDEEQRKMKGKGAWIERRKGMGR